MKLTEKLPRRYPIAFQLRYKATSKRGTTSQGFGETRMMSSKEIIFTPGDGLEPGMKAEIAIAWPFLLDGHIRLQLVVLATITGSQDGVAEARILTYSFRTQRRVETEQRTAPVVVEMPLPVINRPLAAAHA